MSVMLRRRFRQAPQSGREYSHGNGDPEEAPHQ